MREIKWHPVAALESSPSSRGSAASATPTTTSGGTLTLARGAGASSTTPGSGGTSTRGARTAALALLCMRPSTLVRMSVVVGDVLT